MSNNRFPCRLFSFCLISIALLVSFKCAYCIRWLFESALSAVIWTHGHVPRFSFLSRRIQRWSAWYVNSFQWWCLRNMLSNFFFFSLLLPSPFIFTFAYLRPSRFFVFFGFWFSVLRHAYKKWCIETFSALMISMRLQIEIKLVGIVSISI